MSQQPLRFDEPACAAGVPAGSDDERGPGLGCRPAGTPRDDAIPVGPGAWWVPGWLDRSAQRELVDAVREWARPPAGLRRARMPDGTPLHTRAVCLGWHWYPYRYSRTCDDHDGAPVKPFPDLLGRLGRLACEATGHAPVPFDASIVNVYDADSKLGMHQDGSEGSAVAAGSPVVTISLGDTCVFRFGNTSTRGRPYRDLQLASGDLFVFGGPSRLAYHGVPKVFPGSGPVELGVRGRVSVTVRATGLGDPARS